MRRPSTTMHIEFVSTAEMVRRTSVEEPADEQWRASRRSRGFLAPFCSFLDFLVLQGFLEWYAHTQPTQSSSSSSTLRVPGLHQQSASRRAAPLCCCCCCRCYCCSRYYCYCHRCRATTFGGASYFSLAIPQPFLCFYPLLLRYYSATSYPCQLDEFAGFEFTFTS